MNPKALSLELAADTCRLQLDGCTGHATHVDHVVPVRYGGTDHPSNLQAACANCNLV